MSSTTPKQDILNPLYWKERLVEANTSSANLHHAIFKCPLSVWQRIEERHKSLLKKYISVDDHILDVGCGWGRLLTLLPETWKGCYLGIDISPDFIQLARSLYRRPFILNDITKPLPYAKGLFDVAIMISMRPMIKRNLGDEVWNRVQKNVFEVSSKILFLEYDQNDEGEVIYADT